MTYHSGCSYINTTGDTSGTGTACPSGAHEFTPVFSRVRVTRSLILYVCFVDRCLSFCIFSSGHCVVYSYSIYGFWLPLWYLQTLICQYRNICDMTIGEISHFTPNLQISFRYYINQMIEKYINYEKNRFRIIIIYSKDTRFHI